VRVDTFLLPDSLQAAEYNASRRPVSSVHPSGWRASSSSSRSWIAFKSAFEVEAYSLTPRMLDALMASYRDWGGTAQPPTIAIVDWRNVPTWSEFEILQERFTSLGRADHRVHPEELEFDGREAAGLGRRIDLLYGACSSTTSPVIGRVRRARARVRNEGRLHGQLVSAARSAQEGVLLGADRTRGTPRCSAARARRDRPPRPVDAGGRRHPDVEGRGDVRPGAWIRGIATAW